MIVMNLVGVMWARITSFFPGRTLLLIFGSAIGLFPLKYQLCFDLP